MDINWYAYVDVDVNGIIVDGIVGINILPTKQYDYFFFLEENIDLTKHKVVLDGNKPKLIEIEEMENAE